MQELYLGFGGMDIYIEIARRKLKVKDEQGVFTLWQQAAITKLKRILQRAVMHPAAIDKEHDVLAAALCQGPVTDVAMECVVFSSG